MGIRVFELADELEIDRHQLVVQINELKIGFEVDNPATRLTRGEAALVRRAFGTWSSPLVGVWRHESTTRRDSEVITSQTHLVATDDTLRFVEERTYYEDEPDPDRPFEATWNDNFDEARITVERANGRTFCAIARPTEQQLHVRWGGVQGEFPSSFNDPNGLLVAYVLESDPATAARIAAPPVRVARATLQHPRLGAFVLDDNLSWWRTNTTIHNADEVFVSVDGDADLDARRLDRHVKIAEAIDLVAVKSYAASKLLELHNDSWREDDTSIDEATFVSHMALASIGVREDGSVTIYFDDGDLFWGHSIFVSLDREGEPRDAGIAG